MKASTDKAKPSARAIRLPKALLKWQKRFLRVWHQTKSRNLGLEAAAKRWSEVQASIDEDELFSKCYYELMAEFLLMPEDTLIQGCVNGKTNAAVALLEAHDPRYQRKIRVDHRLSMPIAHVGTAERRQARSLWSEIYGRTRPELPPAEDPNVLEAEYVEDESDPAPRPDLATAAVS